MKKVLTLMAAYICMHSSNAQMSTSRPDGFSNANASRFAATMGSSTSYTGTLDPFFSMLYTYCPKTIGFTAFGNTNMLRGYGTVGAGITLSFMTSPQNTDNVFFGQCTAGIGADLYSKSEFESVGVPKEEGSAVEKFLSKIGTKPSLNVLLYGTTINNKEKGGVTIEGYLRIGKLASPLGWAQAQYNVFDRLGVTAYYSNDFGMMGGLALMPSNDIRIVAGAGSKGARFSLHLDTF